MLPEPCFFVNLYGLHKNSITQLHCNFWRFLISKKDRRPSLSFCLCHARSCIPEDVRVSWWLTRKEMESQGIVDLPPPVSSDAFTNLIKCQIKEVIEDFSTVSQITVFHVLDLAFVFHANILEMQYLNCAGMVRVFFTRYRFKDSIFSPLNFRLHSPFSNVYAESYFYYCMLNSNSFFLHYHCNHTEKHLHCDLSLSSISSKKELQLIRVDSEFSIHFIRNLFGTTFGIGHQIEGGSQSACIVGML